MWGVFALNVSEEVAPRLGDVAALIRSKNAGPFMLTIDVMFADRETYDLVRQGHCLSAENVGRIYGISADAIRRFESEPALAIKLSFPRPWVSGSVEDRDIYGGQFHSPLVGIRVV